MDKEFVTYQIALDMKSIGFDEPCLGLYHNDKTLYLTQCKSHEQFHGQVCSAPLYQQAFRWFREKYKLHSTITSISQESWQWHITKPGESLGKLYNEDFYTYEEAELAAIVKLIEIVKKQNLNG